uniref:Uncharacterized protein n=1 Tax=Sciurus vulgaris TaxID=55149 RepID=A0A8D2ADZ6_SCIVU
LELYISNPKSDLQNAPDLKLFEHQHDVASRKFPTMKLYFMHKIIKNTI